MANPIAWERRIQRIQVETDSKDIVDWLTDTTELPPEMEERVNLCKNFLHKPWDLELEKIHRNANNVADHIAKLGYKGRRGGTVMDVATNLCFATFGHE